MSWQKNFSKHPVTDPSINNNGFENKRLNRGTYSRKNSFTANQMGSDNGE